MKITKNEKYFTNDNSNNNNYQCFPQPKKKAGFSIIKQSTVNVQKEQ